MQNNHSTLASSRELIVSVVGYGRFGKLWAELLAQVPYVKKILVYDKDNGNSNTSPTPLPIYRIDISQLSTSHIVFFCVPISKFKQSLEEVLPHLGDNSIICDTCSVKEYPLAVVQSTVSHTRTYLGIHPLFGPDSNTSSRKESSHCSYIEQRNNHNMQFQHTVVVCSDTQTLSQPIPTDTPYQVLCQLFTDMNFSITTMSAEEHDKHAVYSQGLTHLIGRVLQRLTLSASPVSTRGYESLLEIITQTCNDTEELFYDMQRYNRGSVAMYEKLSQALNNVISNSTPKDAQHHNAHTQNAD